MEEKVEYVETFVEKLERELNKPFCKNYEVKQRILNEYKHIYKDSKTHFLEDIGMTQFYGIFFK